MKLTKLNQAGIAHWLVPALVMALVGLVGVRVLTATHAATPTSVSTVNSSRVIPDVPPDTTLSKGALVRSTKFKQGGSCGIYGSTCFYYAVGEIEPQSATGATVSITQAQPTINVKDYHSLGEINVGAIANGTNQNVEIGWTVDPGLNGDNLPHLFVFHWVNGQGTCYNGCGFVSTSKQYTAGQALTVGATGTFTIQYMNEEWVLSYNNTEVGYFPESIWGGDFTNSTIVEIYGEVASGSYYSPQSEMGNGILGSKDKSASFSNFSLIGSNPVPWGVFANEPYKYGNVTASGFNFGGPGFTSTSDPYVNLAYPMVTGKSVSVDGSIVTMPFQSVSAVTWKWGDGSTSNSSVFPTSHTYKKPGTYKVSVTAVQGNGAVGSSSEKVTIQKAN